MLQISIRSKIVQDLAGSCVKNGQFADLTDVTHNWSILNWPNLYYTMQCMQKETAPATFTELEKKRTLLL